VNWLSDAVSLEIPMSKVVNERGDVTEDIAIRLSRVLGSTPRFWIGMQTNLNLWLLEHENKRVYQKMERVLNK